MLIISPQEVKATNQTVKFGLLVECNMRNIFLKKSCTNVIAKLVPDRFQKNYN